MYTLRGTEGEDCVWVGVQGKLRAPSGDAKKYDLISTVPMKREKEIKRRIMNASETIVFPYILED